MKNLINKKTIVGTLVILVLLPSSSFSMRRAITRIASGFTHQTGLSTPLLRSYSRNPKNSHCKIPSVEHSEIQTVTPTNKMDTQEVTPFTHVTSKIATEDGKMPIMRADMVDVIVNALVFLTVDLPIFYLFFRSWVRSGAINFGMEELKEYSSLKAKYEELQQKNEELERKLHEEESFNPDDLMLD